MRAIASALSGYGQTDRPARVVPLLAVVCHLLLTTCGGFTGRQLAPLPAPADPTPLAKWQVAANHSDPLVTKWPASAKDHLESRV